MPFCDLFARRRRRAGQRLPRPMLPPVAKCGQSGYCPRMITQISASAGSGKTYTITERFLKLLQGAGLFPDLAAFSADGRKGFTLQEILAATFTNKAAAEMKSRIIGRLKEDALKELGGQGCAEGASADEGRPSDNFTDFPPARPAGYWVAAILRHYDALNVRTIDSLLNSLVRLSALELNLPPDFSPSFSLDEYYTPVYDGLMEELALYQKQKASSSGQNSVPRLFADGPAGMPDAVGLQPPPDFRDSPYFPDTAGFSNGKAIGSFLTSGPDELCAALGKAAENIVHMNDAKGMNPIGRLRDAVREMAGVLLKGGEIPEMDDREIMGRLKSRHSELRNAAVDLLTALEDEGLSANANFLKFLEACVNCAFWASPPDSVYAAKEDLDACLNKSSRGAASECASGTYARFCAAFCAYAGCLGVFKSALQLLPLTLIARETHARIEANALKTGILPADRLHRLAGEVLAEPLAVSEAMCRMGARLRHIMLDEFQDTSREQWRAIQPLALQCLSQGGSLTYVGDVKQAIYNWRGGDAKLFFEVLEDAELAAVADKAVKAPLEFNWRSRSAIIMLNNAFFAQLADERIAARVMAAMLPGRCPPEFQAEAADLVLKTYEAVGQRIPASRDDGGFAGRVVLYEAFGEVKDDVQRTVKDRCRVLFDELAEKYRLGDIAVLVRTHPEGRLAADWLTEWGFPVVAEDSFLLARHPLILGVVELLRFLDYPLDDQAFWNILSAPGFLPDLAHLGCEPGMAAADIVGWAASARKKESGTPFHQLFMKERQNAWRAWFGPFFTAGASGAAPFGTYEICWTAIRRFGLLERFPDERPFIERFLEIAHLAEERGFTSVSSFLQYWDAGGKEEKLPLPDSLGAVRISTIHAAKGLQYQVVVLPFHNPADSTEQPLVSAMFDGLDLYVRSSQALGAAHYRPRITACLESLNLVYVAWTRAVSEMHAFITSTRHARTNSSLYRGLKVLVEEFRASDKAGLCEWEDLGGGDEPEPGASVQENEVNRAEPGTDADEGRSESYDGGAGNERVGEPAGNHGSFLSAPAMPRLRIFRSSLAETALTPKRRGTLAHLCLEHLCFGPDVGTEKAVDMAVSAAMRLFPLPLANPGEAAADMRKCLNWAAANPDVRRWISTGWPERGIMDEDGNMHRVDLLVDEGERGLLAVEYKTGQPAPEHAGQVRRYLGLLGRSGASNVRGILVYLDCQCISEVSP